MFCRWLHYGLSCNGATLQRARTRCLLPVCCPFPVIDHALSYTRLTGEPIARDCPSLNSSFCREFHYGCKSITLADRRDTNPTDNLAVSRKRQVSFILWTIVTRAAASIASQMSCWVSSNLRGSAFSRLFTSGSLVGFRARARARCGN